MRDPHRMVFPATPRGAAEYALNYGWENAALRGASPYRTNPNGNICGNPAQVGYPSNYQAFPNDADTLLRWLGGGVYPAGFAVANVLAIYECDTATPLVDSLGLGPNLVAGGGPLTGRECVGLGQAGSFTSKVGVEFKGGGDRFADAGNAFMSIPAGEIRSIMLVSRILTSSGVAFNRLCGKSVAPAWELDLFPDLCLFGPGGAMGSQIAGVVFNDGCWHNIVAVLDCLTPTMALRTDMGDVGLTFGAAPASIVSVGSFSLGQAGGVAAAAQCAYLACFDLEVTSAMRANFWRHGLVAVPYLHARLNPLIAPISASRVAAWSGGNVGQAAIGYDASLVTAPLGSGYVCEDGATFEPIGSDDFFGNATAGVAAVASVDGPSGMRDGCRATMAGAFNPLAGISAWLPLVAIAGASDIPWRMDINYLRATVGTTAQAGVYFTGSGAGNEYFSLVADAAAPVDWVRAGGTCTPINNDHTHFRVAFGATANLDNADFGEPAVIKNRTFANLAWRRVGTAAAAVTTTPAYTVANGTNRYYNALTGSFKLIVGGFQGTNGATFFSFGAAAAAGAMVCDYNAGQMRVRVWDAAAALALTLLCGPVTNARHEYTFDWSTPAPLRNIGGAYAAVSEGATVLGAWLATWAPAVTAPATLYIGCDSAGANSARCYVELA